MTLFLLAAFIQRMPAEEGANEAGRQNPLQDPTVLTAADKAEVAEALRLKTELGNQVWPGLGRADIPVILFNDRYEFLMGETNPAGSWEAVEGEDFQGRRYYRRAAKDPQAFAISIGERWAASMSTLGWMNRKVPVKISPDLYVVCILHEVFHAYQANLAPARFDKALAVYSSESRYPAKDKEFAAAWNNEGAILAEALRTKDDAETVRLVRKFLQVRNERRQLAVLGPDLLAYERELEWLEGLAEFVEIKFYELAASRAGEAAFARYRPRLPPYLQWDFLRLERQLGRQNGDLRFYLSGMAQARLLDRLSPGWQEKMMQKRIGLEDLLHATVRGRAK